MEITLTEAARLIAETRDPVELSKNQELYQYIMSIVDSGSGMIDHLSDDEKNAAVSIVMSIAMLEMLARGETVTFVNMIKNPEMFMKIIRVTLQATAGLSIVEEWR